MSDPTLTRERLDELEAMERAATPDIWGPGDMFPLFLYQKHGDDIGKFYRSEDTEFIAALRNDAPALIALARQALDAKAEPAPDPRDALPDPPDRRGEAMWRARDAFAILACERGVNENAASAVGWQKHAEAMRGLARAALAELDAAMKPQEPT